MSKKISIYLILIFFPFFLLLPHTLNFLTMGNDFELLYYSYKKYIFEAISDGVFPLWSPSEGAGFPIVFNPFAQIFYIPSWINFFFFKLFGELTRYQFLLYTIFGISIFNIGQFLWLKELKINYLISFYSTLIISCSLKLNEILRFTNAIHTACWFPWILLGITLAIKKQKKIAFFILFFSTLNILTAGYPYYIFFAFLLSTFYFFFILFNKNFFQRISINIRDFNKLYFFLLCITPVIIAFLLSSPWLFGIFKTLFYTSRANTNWDFATEHAFNFIDILGSLFFPPASSTEGRFYNGAVITFAILLMIIIKLFNLRNEKKLFFILLIYFIMVLSLSMGKDSIIFNFFWELFPLTQHIRTWPRVTIILIPFLGLLVAITINFFKNLSTLKLKNKNYIKYFYLLFFIITFIHIYFLFNPQYDWYWITWHKKRFYEASNLLFFPFNKILLFYDSIIYFFFSILAFLFFFIFLKKKYYNKFDINIFCFLILFFTFLELFLFNNLQWALPQGFYSKESSALSFKENLLNSFEKPRLSNEVKGFRYFRDQRRHNINFPEDWSFSGHLRIYSNYFVLDHGDFKSSIDVQTKNNVSYFYGLDTSARRIFFTEFKDFESINSFVENSVSYEKESNFKMSHLNKFYDGNNLKIIVETQKGGWLSFIDNWHPNWNLKINDKEYPIYKLFNAYKVVYITPGTSTVEFRFKIFE
jgi:hypothetical protein